jgi:hypothetical protein
MTASQAGPADEAPSDVAAVRVREATCVQSFLSVSTCKPEISE